MIAVTLVNSYLIFTYFNDRNKNVVQCYKLLSHETCFNILNSGEDNQSVATKFVSRDPKCYLAKVPKFSKSVNGEWIRPKKSSTNSTSVQHMGAKNDAELFETVLRRCIDAQNIMQFIVETRFRVLKFVRL